MASSQRKARISEAPKGEFYADWDEDSGSYCVFNTESSKAYASYADKGDAQAEAARRNT